MKRINPVTGEPFIRGDIRPDGFVFFTYVKTKVRKTGFFAEKWLSPEAAKRQHAATLHAVRQRNQRVMPDRVAFLASYKLKRGCENCGYKEHACALDLDHIDPANKSFALAQAGTRSWRAVERELAKCRVLCANCHRLRTNGLLTLPTS